MRKLIATIIAVLLILSLADWSFAGMGTQQSNPPDKIREAEMVTFLDGRTDTLWDLSKAYRQTTHTRQRICINGLWRWQPASNVGSATGIDKVPDDEWGYFKVPGCWPGTSDYMQKDSQTLGFHPKWKNVRLSGVTAAWYQRRITVPAEWAERRITVSAEYVNSYAAVYVDGKKAGEILYPAGEADITNLCRPGGTYVLSLHVVSLPLKAVLLSYSDTASAREVKGSVARRGLCGDVFLVGTPTGPRLAEVKVDTSVRNGQITFNASSKDTKEGEPYSLVARITQDGHDIKQFKSPALKAEQRFSFTEKWKPEKLWDIHTPQNMYELHLSLLDDKGDVLDEFFPVRFGFREFWIDGKDFYLNGSRIFLSAVPLDNTAISAATATYGAAKESFKRIGTFGINFVYTHNYGCEPGAHLSFSEILRAADDYGMLVALSMPHFSHYDWDAPDANQSNGYARLAKFYAHVAQNHPSVIMYSTSHNATGYGEDMNPDMIDGIHDKRDRWAINNMKKALRAESIIKQLDPSRIVYHHASGNLGSMHDSNFYPNFVPIQEMSDWFEHWATEGVKPVFMCEYGAPFTWDWAMYRGWYKGKREFGSAVVPWEFCLAEWNAQFFGDRAFQISEMEKSNLRWESRQFRNGKTWHRWDYPHQLGSADFPERDPVFAMYYTDNWRAFRTWGVSADSPWEHDILFKLRPGVDRNRREEFKLDLDNLQRPGYSPDYIEQRYERMDLAYEASDWIPTAGAEALIRNNRPLLAYIGGKSGSFTSKDHNFFAGETIEKQIIVINNSRLSVSCECSWSLALPEPIEGHSEAAIETGRQTRIPISFTLPTQLKPGEYKLSAKVEFNTGEAQDDEFLIHVLAKRALPPTEVKIAVFDPNGQTTESLRNMGVLYDAVDAKTDLGAYEVLIIGKAALTVNGPAPDISRVLDGLKVIVFEQTPDVLEKRLGFRVAEYGLRNVFRRVPDHPALAGLQTENLRDWRGEATILAPRLNYTLNPKFNYVPTVNWCGIPVTRLWRCDCRGNVASVLIEKPACGDFLPIVDGGFSLQYSPLMEYREGKGLVLFCQMDVTGRTETDPAAEILISNIIEYVRDWKPSPRREVLYTGEPEGLTHLRAAGFKPGSYDGGELKSDQVLIVGPGNNVSRASSPRFEGGTPSTRGGYLLAIGLSQEEVDALLPFKVSMNRAEYINAYFDPPGVNSLLAGVGPADVHNRDPRTIPLVSGDVMTVGNGVLAVARQAEVVFCQLVPWQFEYQNNFGLKRTFRRTSFLVTRLLGNLGVSGETPLLVRLSSPVESGEPGRWLNGFYLDKPEEWDDPYRFFRW
jgi:beta-galactosidase